MSGSPFPAGATLDAGWVTKIGGVSVEGLAARFGTPLYVLDRSELVARMRAYRRAFGDDVTVVYAAKALCVVGVLQLAAEEGLHVDVASAGELYTAERAGFPMERVVFHGNNKSEAELERAAALGVGRVVVDSFSELRRMSAVSGRTGREFNVHLRITPGLHADTHDFVRTGHDDSKFGFTLSAGLAHAAVREALGTPGVRLVGLHCHLGSQLFDPGIYRQAAAVMVELLAEVDEELHQDVPELNLGGGLGISYTDADPTLTVDDYAVAVLTSVSREVDARGIALPRVMVEPGRSIVGPAGVTLYTVGTVKQVPNARTYVSVDGGMSDNLRPALYGSRYTFAPAGSRPSDTSTEHTDVTVVGKHCESGDVLGRGVPLPASLGEGDILAVASTGAYGHAMASNYNRLPRPAMVLVGDGAAQLLVRRETLDDVLARDVPLGAASAAPRWGA